MVSQLRLELCKLFQPFVHLVNDGVRSGSPRGQADGFSPIKPDRPQIARVLNMINARTKLSTLCNHLGRVAAVRPANHDDHIALTCQFISLSLALIRCLAGSDGIPRAKAHTEMSGAKDANRLARTRGGWRQRIAGHRPRLHWIRHCSVTLYHKVITPYIHFLFKK